MNNTIFSCLTLFLSAVCSVSCLAQADLPLKDISGDSARQVVIAQGTPTLYQGDELGIGRVAIPPERVRDPQDLRQPGLGLGRDHARTPMPWDSSPYAGFSTAEPWLPLNEDWPTRNVAAQEKQPQSMLNLHRRLLALRREHSALSVGDIEVLPSEDEVLQYERRHESERLLVVLNLGAQSRSVILPDGSKAGAMLISTREARAFDGRLLPDEGLVLQLVKD